MNQETGAKMTILGQYQAFTLKEFQVDSRFRSGEEAMRIVHPAAHTVLT
jgi:hypothetical protein